MNSAEVWYNVHRFLVLPSAVRGALITLNDPREVHHLRQVLRLGVGDRITCMDGEGTEYIGTIIQERSGSVVVRADRPPRSRRQACQLELAPALLKWDRFDWVVQKATELGVSRLRPVVTCRTVMRLSSEQASRKQLRWQRIAQEAAKQCGRASVPEVTLPRPVEAVLSECKPMDLVLIPTLAVSAMPLADALRSTASAFRTALVLVGPEGDFSREEIAQAQAYGARPVSLGSRTLRSETAAVALLAVLSYLIGEL